MEMVLSGEPISAEEAKAIGLISKVVENNVLEEALALAKKIAKFSLPAVCLCKKAVNASLETNLASGLATELQLFNISLTLKDKEEGISAVFNKRVPKFTNS